MKNLVRGEHGAFNLNWMIGALWMIGPLMKNLVRGEHGAFNLNWMIGALVLVLLAVNVIPIIVTTISQATGTGGALENTSVAPLFNFLPILITIGLVVAVLVAVKLRGGRD